MTNHIYQLKGKWIRQYIVLVSFYVFDYISTTYYCKNPNEEWNPIARFLMILLNDVKVGMTAFLIIIAILWYIVLIPISQIIENAKKNEDKTWYNRFVFTNFVVFSSIAGWDFGFGASSWFWHIPVFYRMLVGSLLYVTLYFLWINRN